MIGSRIGCGSLRADRDCGNSPEADGSTFTLWPQIRQACTDLVLMDKKRRGDQISFVMPRAIGNVTFEDIPLHELYAFLEDASWI